jgi:hypothetical protein
MTNRKYEYYPAWDGKVASPGILELVKLCKDRWATKSLGTYVHRNMNNDIKPPQLSVHATGSAADIQYKNEAQARFIWDWLLGKSTIAGKVVENSKVLGISEIHWYAFGTYGAGYRCSRGEGKTGVKIFTMTDNAGSDSGTPNWLHIEIDQAMSKDAAKFAKAWASLPYP